MRQFKSSAPVRNLHPLLRVFGNISVCRSDVEAELRAVSADQIVVALDYDLVFSSFHGSDFNGIAFRKIRLANVKRAVNAVWKPDTGRFTVVQRFRSTEMVGND